MNKDYLYKPDKAQVHEMKVNLHQLKKRLPDADKVKNLIIEKKKVHRKVIHGVLADEVSIRSGLQNLHYSEAGRTPHESDLGE